MYDWAKLCHFRYLAILERQRSRVAAARPHTAQLHLIAYSSHFQENASLRLSQKSRNRPIHPTETETAWHSDHLRIGLRHRPCLFTNLMELDCGSVLCCVWGPQPMPRLRSACNGIQPGNIPAISTLTQSHFDTPAFARPNSKNSISSTSATSATLTGDIRTCDIPAERRHLCA
jgi:hypothetical protein